MAIMILNDVPGNLADDAYRSLVLDRANAPVRIRNHEGRLETVTEFEARFLELASGNCRRRLYCTDFIQLVLKVLRL